MATRFKVEGSIQFPFDMLRYDSCWPETSEDVIEMLETQNVESRLEYRRANLLFKVKMVTIGNITPERWASFGWRIVK